MKYTFYFRILCAIVSLFFYCFSNVLYACNDVLLENKISSLGYPKKIKNNIDLLLFIESEYGPSAVKLLKEKHKYFGSSGRLDIQTLDWLIQQKKQNKYQLSNYASVIGGDSEEVINKYVEIIIDTFNSGVPKTIPVFDSDKQASAFISKLKNKKELMQKIVANNEMGVLDPDFLYKSIVQYFVIEKSYLVSLSHLNLINKSPILHISGFKDTIEDGIITLDDDVLTAKKFADYLQKLMLPRFTTVKLDACLHGCETYPLKLKKSEILELIDESKIDFLQQHFQSDFLDVTFSEYKKSDPLFSGKFVGQLGERHKYVDNLKYFDGHFGNGYANIVFASDDEIDIDEKALMVESGSLPFFNMITSDMQEHLKYNEMKYIKQKSNKYYEINVGSVPRLKQANGSFIFVIPFGYPKNILFYEYKENSITIGHSSLSRGRSVHFAGEAKFIDGELIYWSNSSGHYQPTKEAIHYLPDLTQLLPISKFEEYVDI